MNQLRAQTESEKPAAIIEAAQKAMRGERELNDFIAHEVRNPLAAAMSASSFVTASVNDETKPFSLLRAAVNEDLRIIDNALHFINDLLRNMLDMQRAHSNQLSISYAPVDILQDVFFSCRCHAVSTR
ncbi:phosphorelay sensor kinase [Fragilaria crotonensis]|nr:phosphorelay sensor kinase [Fragilaria crotonensis]